MNEKISFINKGKFNKIFSPQYFIDGSKKYLFFVGTNSIGNERAGYKISYVDCDSISKVVNVITANNCESREYSPFLMRRGNILRMYYAENSGIGYQVYYKEGHDLPSLSAATKEIVHIGPYYDNFITYHTPKIVQKENKLVMLFTGSHTDRKQRSNKYNGEMFSDGFRIMCAYSNDGIYFNEIKTVNVQNQKMFKNMYGHNIQIYNNEIYFIFTGFDGSINRLYFSKCKGFENVNSYRELLSPNIKNGEIGIYSCTFIILPDKKMDLVYGVRYLYGRWELRRAVIDL